MPHFEPSSLGQSALHNRLGHLTDTYIANTRQFLFKLTAGEANIALGSTNDELGGCTTSKHLYRSST